MSVPTTNSTGANAHQCKDGKTSSPAPYFDAILGRPMPDLPPFCDFWYRRLIEASISQASSFCEIDNENNDLTIANKRAAFTAARELLCCYESIIHPCVKKLRHVQSTELDGDKNLPLQSIIEIVSHYELLLVHFIQLAIPHDSKETGRKEKCKVASENIAKVTYERNEIIEDMNELSGKFEKIEVIEAIKSTHGECQGFDAGDTIYAIADDITQWTAKLPNENKELLWKIRNILLPYLLRLAGHAVALLSPPNGDVSIGSGTGATCLYFLDSNEVKKALAVATVVAAPFVGDGNSKSGSFGIGSLLEWILQKPCIEGTSFGVLSLAHTVKHSSLSPIAKDAYSETEQCNPHSMMPLASILSNDFLTRPVIDCSVKTSHFGAEWTDGVMGVGSRTAMWLLKKICKVSCLFVSEEMGEKDDGAKKYTENLSSLFHKIGQNVGISLLTSVLRAQFYARLVYPSTSLDKSNAVGDSLSKVAFMPMIDRVGSVSKRAPAATTNDEKPYTDIPMRLSAAAIILSSVFQQPTDFDACDKAFSDALPVVLSLLDELQPINQGVGALVFVSIMEACTALGFEFVPSFVQKFSIIITKSFECAIQLCGREDATVLAIICLAQSKWFQFLEEYLLRTKESPLQSKSPLSLAIVHAWTRKAASDLLIAIGKQTQTRGSSRNEERIAGALVAGINPLLSQIANFPRAASIEIARVGLSTILPLVGWRGMSLESRSIQVAALSGLLSLLDGAYPIMTHHGAKIMVEIFILLDSADKDAMFLQHSKSADSHSDKFHNDEVSTDTTTKIAVHAAAVSLLICGKSAEDVLEHIAAKRSGTQHNRCIEIRALSSNMRNVYS